ncbi:MAG: penicillin-binding protein 1C [Leptothrix sp. (in: b-proteobacteria)]
MPGCAVLFAAMLGLAAPAHALPSYAEVRAAYVPSQAQLLARDGTPLQSLRLDLQVRRLDWTPLAEIAPALQRAVILAEDQRFMEHDGVDWAAAGHAAWSNFWRGNLRGASTLTMQLAGLLDEDQRRQGRRSLFGKLGQAATALRLERQWRKPQILEAYLNLAAFRGELQGVAAMSRMLYGKWPAGLDEREAAIAAALLRAPNAAPERVSQRACALLKERGRGSECAELDSLARLALAGGWRQGDDIAPQAPHLAHKLLRQPGERLRSSLDAALQRFASQSLREHLGALEHRQVEDGAVLVLDNRSGEVLAWVGSSGSELSGAAEVDGVTALRQAGSTLKPFLYGIAFEQRQLTPAALIEDAPLTLDTGNGLYAPQNYEPQYRGWVSARSALAGSLNVPAVKTLVRVTPDLFQQRLRRFGLESLKESGDWYGYSLALGSADVSLLMLTNAYRSLANGGRWTPLRLTPAGSAQAASATAASTSTAPRRTSAPDGGALPCRDAGCAGVFSAADRSATPRQVLAAPAAFLVGQILSDRNARAGTFGLNSWLATPYWAAVKTGTSKDMRDNWCVGYSSRYTVGVWVGNASGQPMHDVSGVTGAAPVWREVLDWLHRGDAQTARARVPSVAPTAPPGVTQQAIRFEPAIEPPRQEWFVAGTGSPVIRAASARALAHIDTPADGSILALDPDIPPGRQRIALRLSGPAGPGWRWQMDGQPIGLASQPQRWLLQPGRHHLLLQDARGQTVEAVRFEVRALKGRSTHR